ncbi:hypothetical protein AJ78_01640 [Emergomyces pasteurianus Ep9510]|uniref:NADP-dependent oxidoreductase domain-containing protein n=1 Tax=Emergomyces pasteurianus Ep9510 TaxID=1447872 RepID=A0A1J9QQ66_9EURO|nr:hypothetical protein AJ78_01640 [Emergomyces pasteurianus Ep9510]
MLSKFQNNTNAGFTAFDMADHYGDAEIVRGQFRSAYLGPKSIFCATKYCVFEPITVTEYGMRDAASQRLANINPDKIDLLQFHWHDYNNSQYTRALQLLQADERVTVLGRCNFDTKRMEEIINAGVKVATNQVQDTLPPLLCPPCSPSLSSPHLPPSVVRRFPLQKMDRKRRARPIWPRHDPQSPKVPRKINIWGFWLLFQTLLRTLSTIGRKHNVSVSAVAVRWVLDFSYVGAVIVSACMGVSEHTEDNLAVYGWRLDGEDKRMLDEVLSGSRRGEMFRDMGDCGAEYRR